MLLVDGTIINSFYSHTGTVQKQQYITVYYSTTLQHLIDRYAWSPDNASGSLWQEKVDNFSSLEYFGGSFDNDLSCLMVRNT